MTLTILVIGGYGTFGGRLCRLLADEPRVRLLVAGRSAEKARAFCRHPSAAELVPVAFDRDGDVRAEIARLAPDLVVDASGPFQTYGADAYRAVDAAIAAGADYIDLADGRDFVGGFGSRDAAAKAAGRFALTAASTFPVLTVAAARALAVGVDRVDAVAAGIAPSPHAGVGLNVMRAIASYAGKPVRLIRNGASVTPSAIVDSRHHTVIVPGSVPLNRVRFSLVNVPDLDLLPEVFPGLRSVWIGAGPTPAILHRALSGLARLVTWRLLPRLMFLAPLMDWCMDHVSWGEHRGGMFVELRGSRSGAPLVHRWHMIAEGDSGPFIPAVAADIVIRACLDGHRPPSGARPCHDDVTLADYERSFARLGVSTAILRGDPSASLPLNRQLLGAAYAELSPLVQAAHDVTHELVLEGTADVDRGKGFLAGIVATLSGMPASGRNIPVRVTMTRKGDAEVWDRRFATGVFRSVMVLGTGRDTGLMHERIGPMTFALAHVVRDGKLHLVPRRWRFLGIPMPRFLLPKVVAFEHGAGGRFNFDVEIGLPLVGRVIAYKGALIPARARE